MFYGAQDACESLTLRYVIALREAFIKASTFRAVELDTASFHAIIILMRELPIGTKNRESREIGFLSHWELCSYIFEIYINIHKKKLLPGTYVSYMLIIFLNHFDSLISNAMVMIFCTVKFMQVFKFSRFHWSIPNLEDYLKLLML